MSSAHALRLRLAPWALLLVSASWGLAFVVMKDAIERQSVNSFLFSRFSLAVVVMLLIKPSVVKTVAKIDEVKEVDVEETKPAVAETVAKIDEAKEVEAEETKTSVLEVSAKKEEES